MIYQFPDYKVISQHNNLKIKLHQIKARLERFDTYSDRTIFTSCHSSDGQKMSICKQKAILDYLNSPTVEKWDAIYKFQVTPNKTLWDAWNKTSNKKIVSVKLTTNLSDKWYKIPKPEELVSGINKIVNIEKRKLLGAIERLEFEMSTLEFKYGKYLQKYA